MKCSARRDFRLFGALVSVLLPAFSQEAPPTIPQRGILPTGSYSVGDIETIDHVSGNVTLRIPLTSLPSGRGNFSADFSLIYNSSIYAIDGMNILQSSNAVTDPTESGGWRYSFDYLLTDDYTRSVECSGPPNNFPGPAGRRFRIITPDGSSHLLFTNSTSFYYGGNTFGFGYYLENVLSGQCYDTTQPPAGTFDFYTVDGTYIRVRISIGSGIAWNANSPWTAYFPDGRTVTGVDDYSGATRVSDRNGNGFSISRYGSQTNPVTTLYDDLGRSINIQSNIHSSSASDAIQQQSSTSTSGSSQPALLNWTVAYGGDVIPSDSLHQYDCTPPGASSQHLCDNTSAGVAVTSITLPQQLANNPQSPLTYIFSYATSYTDSNNQVQAQWGQLSGLTLPSGASVQYRYSPSCCFTAGPRLLPLISKTLLWSDDLSHSEVTSYSYADTSSTITNADGGTETYSFTSISNPGYPYQPAVVTGAQYPSGDSVNWVWSYNPPFEGSSSFGGNLNPIKTRETTSIGGTSALTRNMTYDRNGNITTLSETDAISSAARTTTRTFVNGAGGSSVSNGGSTPDSNGYWNALSPQILNLPLNQALSGVSASVTFQYDGGVLSRGNVTKITSYDSATGQSEVVQNTYDNYGTYTGCPNTYYSGAPPGNLTLSQNAAGHTTLFCYDTHGDRMIQRLEAVDSATDVRTFAYTYDSGGPNGVGWTGRLLSEKDSDHSATTSYRWDAFGRTLYVDEAGIRQTQTVYDSVLRKVSVTSDLASHADQLLTQSTQYDQLWRVWKTTDAAGNIIELHRETPAGATGFSYDLVSNPYSGAISGWTRTKRDAGGRVTEVNHFTGAARPTPWAGTDPTSSGIRTVSYSGNCQTDTDESGVSKTSCIDGFSRLRSVLEIATAATTSYLYDSLNNLTSVSTAASTQGLSSTTYQGRSFSYSSLGRLVSATNPESGTTSYAYWPGGNLKTHSDANGVVVTNYYNAIDQLTSKVYSNSTPGISYSYSKSWLTSVQSGSTSYSYSSFDSIGRVLGGSQTTATSATTTYAFTATYYPFVGIRTLTYPGTNRTLTTSYDSAGRPYGVSGDVGTGTPTNYVVSTTYQPHGAMLAQSLAGGGLSLGRSDNARLQPTSLTAANSSTTLLNMGYTYNSTTNNGNITQQTTVRRGLGAGSWTQTYGYTEPTGSTSINRLTSVSEAGGPAYTYGYDAVGNRWVSYPTTGLSLETPTAQSWYISSGGQTNNRINTWGYDGNGNVLSIGGMTRSYTYDGENRVSQATVGSQTTLYGYDGGGRRVTKLLCPSGMTSCNFSTSGASITTYVYDLLGNLAQEYGSDAPLATIYLVPDALGSTRLVTDATGNPLRCYDYLPFGEELPAGVNGRPPGCYGAAVISPSVPDFVNQKFTGKERDTESGLDYLGARYLSAAQGRFTSPDVPLRDQIPGDPQSWHLYAYVRSNPLIRTDPTGRECVTLDGGAQGDDGNGTTCAAAGLDVTHGVVVHSNGASEISVNHPPPTGPSSDGITSAPDELLVGLTAGRGAASIVSGLVGRLGRQTAAEVLIQGNFGAISRSALEAAANSGGSTVRVVTQLTRTPAAGRALSTAVGEGAEALAAVAQPGGQLYVANIPRALIQVMKGAGLVLESTTTMGGGPVATELRFLPQATEFVVKFFH